MPGLVKETLGRVRYMEWVQYGIHYRTLLLLMIITGSEDLGTHLRVVIYGYLQVFATNMIQILLFHEVYPLMYDSTLLPCEAPKRRPPTSALVMGNEAMP